MTDGEVVTRLRALADEIEARGGPAPPEGPATPAEPPAPAAAQPDEPAPIAWGAKVSTTFRDRVRWIVQNLDIGPAPGRPEPNWPMTWMAFETARTFSPTAKNPGSSATGLIQFMQDTAQNDLDTTLEHLRSLSAEDQLNFVWRYLRNRIREHGPIRSLSDGYMSILLPSAMGKPDGAVLWPKGTKAYFANRGLDANADGAITKAEAAAKIYATLAEGLKPENLA